VKNISATVVSVHTGSDDELDSKGHASVQVELDGVVGDHHRSYTRKTWAGGDKQPEGTTRRNERQWSAVSVEELRDIQNAMDVIEPLSAASLGVNLCIEGVPELSRLPKGTLFKFPSGAELIVEDYNPPCRYMGEKLAGLHKTHSGKPVSTTAFSKASKLSRGIVGSVEVAGVITAGDEVVITVYETPSWLVRSADA
jgi:MOSC domain-containing protein YiiM